MPPKEKSVGCCGKDVAKWLLKAVLSEETRWKNWRPINPERTILTLDYNDAEEEADKTNIDPESSEKTAESGEKNAGSGEKNAGSGEKNAGSGEKINIKTRDKLLFLIKGNPNITIAELSEKLQKVQSVVIKHISKLKSSGHLRRVGSDKGGHWEVLEGQ